MRTEAEPRKPETPGTIATINSLNSQLARQLQGHADLSFLITDENCWKRQSRLGPALKLLRRLIDDTPETESISIVINSLSRLSGNGRNEKRLIKGISQLVDRSADTGPVVKILMTDLLPEHLLHRAARSDELYVPDRVDGGGHDLNTEYLREVAEASIGRFESQCHGAGSASDIEGHSDGSENSDSDVDASEEESD